MRALTREYTATWVHEQVRPTGELTKVFQLLSRVPPRAIRATRAELREVNLMKEMEAAVDRLPERELKQMQAASIDLGEVLTNFEQRLPRKWVDLMCWGHWVATSLLPLDMPGLRNAFEALIEHEPQLHLEPYYPNRDHLVHQIADSCLAVDLHRRAARSRRDYDQPDWELLQKCVPGLEDKHRDEVVEAGLALAGLTHDIGYLRYVGATARERLAAIFGVTAPAVSMEPRDLARLFAGSLLDRMLAPDPLDPTKTVGDGNLVDIYQAAWKKGDHGPFSATVLASVGRGLALEGRSIPVIEAALQVAAAAAYCHELHPTKDEEDDSYRPAVIAEARRRLKGFRWPALFRIVDEMQCWFRPELRSDDNGDTTRVSMGARSLRYEGKRLIITSEMTEEDEQALKTRFPGAKARGGKEAKALRHLRRYLAKDAGVLFQALGINDIQAEPPT